MFRKSRRDRVGNIGQAVPVRTTIWNSFTRPFAAILGSAILTLFASPPLCLAAKPERPSARLQPLTYTNVISFFREALRRAPVTVDKRCAIFAEGEWKSPNVYSHSVIIVENADDDVEITFVMTGDEGMNWVNEFIDSQFFNQRETEAFFGVLNRGLGKHNSNIGRFRVELSRWEPRHHEIVVLSLTPRQR